MIHEGVAGGRLLVGAALALMAATGACGCREERGVSSAASPSIPGDQVGEDDVSDKTRKRASAPRDAFDAGAPARAKAARRAPPRVPTFSVRAAGLTDADLEARLEAGEVPPETVDIDLTSNELTARSIDLLAQASLTRVRSLLMSGNNLGDAGAAAIADAPIFADLQHLDVGYNGITIEGLRALVAADTPLRGVRTLSLDGTALGGEGIELLVSSPVAATLRGLALRDAGLTDDDARVLAEAKSLAGLRSLRVGHNPITEEGLRALRESPYLKDAKIHAP